MIVCVCNNVSEDTIIKEVEENGIIDIEALKETISVCNQCCMCEKYINNLIALVAEEAA